jgi:protein-tyrosine-phosphatase
LRLNPNNIGPIAEVVVRRLAKLEVKPTNAGRPPEAVKEADLEDAALVVAMSQQEHYPLMKRMFPTYADQITYWDVEDTGRIPLDVAFQRIELLVDRLINLEHLTGS